MLANEYTSVSANKAIVFTCFFITFICLCLWAMPAIANVNANNSAENNPKNEGAAHRNLESQLYSFIENTLLASYGNDETSNDIRIQVRKIDERIHIPFCNTPYEFDSSNSPQQQSNISVKVACSNTNWYLFMHANVVVIETVVVTRDNLSPGSLLSSRNLDLVEMDKNRLRGSTFSSIADVVGARIKRRTRAGNVIDERMLCFICKGDRVTIAAVSSGLSIKVYGIAEEDGVLGDTIQVRNISSDKLVFAKIASTSQVEINI
ncbi:MAG: flagella basal body P-ring formation protein FlgA [Kangiellaceae bacterium]|jgi:flagella basal body P-ring formation protein FlgA